MMIFYDLLFSLIALIFLPVYILRGKLNASIFTRLGFLPRDIHLNRPIWVHAVSVGEAITARGLIEELRKAYPDKKIVISTVTSTGNRIAREIARKGDLVTYLPLDLSFIVRRVIRKINPSVFIVAETEFWPNLILELNRKNIPVITVNGRISDDSFRGYSRIRFILKPILNKVSLFCMQSEHDAKRLKSLGVAESKIKVSGNMKFDAATFKNQDFKPGKKRELFSLLDTDKLLVCGSTHLGEEEVLLSVYKDLLKEFPGLKILLAPRHPERSGDIEKSASRLGFHAIFASTLPYKCQTCLTHPVFILDSIGELSFYYAAADIVFVGGSLVEKGGHNILEPAFLGKPVIFGPYMSNFRDISRLFIENRAAIQIKDVSELKTKIRELLLDASLSQNIGLCAKKLVLDNLGSTKRTLELIRKIIPPQSILS